MDAAFIDEYEEYDLRHWWHVVRRRIIHHALDYYAPAGARWLDVGCGPGILLASYSRIEQKIGLEVDEANVRRALQRGVDARISDARWDFTSLGSFDLITACDVLEHVSQDQAAVQAVHNALRQGGIFLATVPALRSLWSGHDVVSHHYRRYTHRTLAGLFPGLQWEILHLTYFSTLLFPLIWSVRKLKNMNARLTHSAGPPTHDVRFGPPWRDRMLQGLFSLECPWLEHGGRFPIGSSLLVVARVRK